MPAFHLRPADMLRAYAQEIEQIYNSIKETLFFPPTYSQLRCGISTVLHLSKTFLKYKFWLTI